MAIDFSIKTGDTAPPLVAVLKDALSNVVNLTGGTAKFILRDKATGTKIVDAPASVTDAVNGKVTYLWQTGDTAVADSYNGEFEIHWPDGTFETFPNNKYIQVKIFTDLGGTVTHS